MPAKKGAPRKVIVDIGRGYIKMAATQTAGEAVRFTGITQVQLPAGTQLGETDLTAVIHRLKEVVVQQGWSGYSTDCLLSGSVVSTQSMILPRMPEGELRQAIGLKLEETLHFDVEDAVFDFSYISRPESKQDNKVCVLVVAAQRKAINSAAQLALEAGLRPVSVCAAGESLANLSAHTCIGFKDEASIHIDLGTETSVLNLFDGRVLRFSREIGIAGDSFIQALMRPIISKGKVSNLEWDQAKEIIETLGFPSEKSDVELPDGISCANLLPLVEPVAQRLATEIQRSVRYLKGILNHTGSTRLVLFGAAGRMPNLGGFLAEQLETSVLCLDPVERAISHWRLALCDENPPPISGFSAVLGHSLGYHRPVNLLERDRRIIRIQQRDQRIKRARVPTAISLVVGMSLAAFPINLQYSKANNQMQALIDGMDEELLAYEEVLEARNTLRTQAEDVESCCGGAPHWVGVLKELSHVFPEGVQISAFEMNRLAGVQQAHLTAHIYQDADLPASVLAELSQQLSHSPFFTNVRVLDASLPTVTEPGVFEATMELVSVGHIRAGDRQ